MKQNLLKTFLLCLFSFAGMSSFGYDCEVDGIYYNLNSTKKTAEVTYSSYPDGNNYSGVVHIPSVIEYDGVLYTVNSIGVYAFYGCEGLTEVVIPNSVLNTGNSVFNSCSNLTSVTVGSGVSSIRGFAHCYALTSITFLCTTPPDISLSSFGTTSAARQKIFDNATLYVPAGCKERYQQAKVWGEFANIQETDYVSTDIPINEENFPDENFRDYLRSQDYGRDGVLTEEEISGVTAIDLKYLYIGNLKGIEYFTALTYLNCFSTNGLESLDISANTALTYLDCSYNMLTSLDVSANTALTHLNCGQNLALTTLDVSTNTALKYLACYSTQLATLDVSQNIALDTLYCHANQLTALDVSQNTALTRLWCYSNQLTSLDLSQNKALLNLNCSSNQLTSLDVSGCTALTYLDCSSNQLTSLDVSNKTSLTNLLCHNNQLETLNVSGCSGLTDLRYTGNPLTSLNISGCTALTTLYYYGELVSLDASGCAALTNLDCSGNPLTFLNVSGCTALTSLSCIANRLTSLDVSGCTALTNLDCSGNQQISLDVSECTLLTNIRCFSNEIKGESMDALISSLPQNTTDSSYGIYIKNSDTDENICTKSQVAAIKAKGWTPYHSVANSDWGPSVLDWVEYEGSDDDASGIDAIQIDKGEKNVIYTLDGVRLNTTHVSDLPKGIYVVNGKKLVVK